MERVQNSWFNQPPTAIYNNRYVLLLPWGASNVQGVFFNWNVGKLMKIMSKCYRFPSLMGCSDLIGRQLGESCVWLY